MKQRKNKLKNYLKLGVFLFGISLVLWNCEKEDTLFYRQQIISFKTMSFQEAKIFFKKKKLEFVYSSKSNMTPLKVTPLWETIQQDSLNFTDALLTNIETEINREGNYSTRAIFFKINDVEKAVLETYYATTLFENGNIKNGKVYYNTLEGDFLIAYVIENGIAIKKLVPKYTSQASFFSFINLFKMQGSDCWNTDTLNSFDGGVLDEVVIVTSSNGGETGLGTFMQAYSSSGEFIGGGGASAGNGNSGGAGDPYLNPTTGECIDGYIKNDLGICVEIVENVPPDCASFDYTRVGTTNWQTAAVSGIRELFTVFNWECTGFDFGTLPQAIYFQLPINSNYPLNSSYTKRESAATLHEAFKAFDLWYKNHACASSYSLMTSKFLELIKSEFENIGGNATITPPNGYSGTINAYQSTWGGYGDCN